MYKVLIVDDEPLIREGLQTIVEWERYGFEVVGSATDGLDALDKIGPLAPDLLIVDVRMPRLDGLGLIRAMQERGAAGRQPHFLILSGHADFEYARQAMAMRADGYMLKPVDEDELAGHLTALKGRLDEEARLLADGAGAAAERDAERIVTSLLAGDGKLPPAEAIAQAGLGGASFEVVLVKLQSRQEIDAELAAKVKRKLGGAFAGIVFSLDPYVGIVLTGGAPPGDAGDSAALRAAHRALASACAEAGLDFAAVTGGSVGRLPELERSYRNALAGMRGRFALDGGRIYAWDRVPGVAGGSAATGGGAAASAAAGAGSGANASAPPGDAAAPGDAGAGPNLDAARERLLLALDIGNEEAAAALVRELGAQMTAAAWSEQGVKGAFVQLLTTVLNKLAQSRPELKEQCRAYAAQALDIYAEYRLSGLLERLAGMTRDMAADFRGYGADQQMQKLLELIRRHYSENLKLESLAEVFNYNSSYLGKLFKNTTGQSFNSYLDQVRIEKAKELLEEGMKVYQVAELVGYSNVDYFHGKFRKYVGTSPSAYRKK